MDNSNSFPMKLIKMSENIECLAKFLQDERKFERFVSQFDFKEIVNINIHDSKCLNAAASVIGLLVQYKKFYDHSDHITHFLEFIVRNLMKCIKCCDEVLKLLELLYKILADYVIYTSSTINGLIDRIVDVERLLQCILRVSCFDKKTAKYCYAVLEITLQSNNLDKYPHIDIDTVFLKLFENFKHVGAICEMCAIFRKITEKCEIFNESYRLILDWLIEEGPQILSYENQHPGDITAAAVNSFTDLLNVWEDQQLSAFISRENQLLMKLFKYSGDICLHSSHKALRKQCFYLLEFILIGFLHRENVPFPMTGQKIREILYHLPEDVEDWYKTDIDWFFCICHIVMLNYSGRSFLWKNDNILHSITCWSMRVDITTKQSITSLKSILYIYPHLITNNSTVGDKLLKLMSSDVTSLLSYNNSKQLEWILASGDDFLKFSTIIYWLNKASDTSLDDGGVLESAIKSCHAQDCLLRLLLRNVENEVKLKIATVLKRVNNEEIGMKTSRLLPFCHKNIDIFGYLLLTHPRVLPVVEESLYLCGIMGAIMPFLMGDVKIVKVACKFSYELLMTLRNQPDAVRMFCKNPSNIHQLIKYCDDNEEVSNEIIDLLLALLIVQTTTAVTFNQLIQGDFTKFLNGSCHKTQRSLVLIYAIITWKNPFIIMSESSVYPMFEYLFEALNNNPKLAGDGYKCVTALIHKKNWLALTCPIRIHIEMVCTDSPGDFPGVAMFLNLLKTWLEILHTIKKQGFVKLMNFEIKRFLFKVHDGSLRNTVEEINSLLNNFPANSELNVFRPFASY